MLLLLLGRKLLACLRLFITIRHRHIVMGPFRVQPRDLRLRIGNSVGIAGLVGFLEPRLGSVKLDIVLRGNLIVQQSAAI